MNSERKLEMPTTTTTTTTTVLPTTTKSYTPRPTVFFASRFAQARPEPQCYCPCNSNVVVDKKPRVFRESFETQKILFELGRGYTTEEPVTTDSPDYEENTTVLNENDQDESPTEGSAAIDEPEKPAKNPRYFQAFEFADLVSKIDPRSVPSESSNEEEPSNEIINCIGEFLGCIEQKNSDEYLASRAKNCYQLFQDCSGSVILIPDLIY